MDFQFKFVADRMAPSGIDQLFAKALVMIRSRHIGSEIFYSNVLYCGVILDNLGIPFS